MLAAVEARTTAEEGRLIRELRSLGYQVQLASPVPAA
jgi:hypothetical protein